VQDSGHYLNKEFKGRITPMTNMLRRDITGDCEGECRDRVREGEEERQDDINASNLENPESYPDASWARSRNEQPGVSTEIEHPRAVRYQPLIFFIPADIRRDNQDAPLGRTLEIDGNRFSGVVMSLDIAATMIDKYEFIF
jgi:hypothetical protein